MGLQTMVVLSQQLFSTNNCHNNVTGAEKIVNAVVYMQEDSLGNKDHSVYALSLTL